MSKSKSTKKALVLSSLSIATCGAMLIGTTFAWFTDTASASINSIQSGILDIELQTKDADGNWVDATNQYLSFVKATGAEDEEILWEPGCTYELQDLRIINKSNLALKYKVVISGIQGDSKLNEAIDWIIELDGSNVTAGEEMVWLPSEDDASMVKEFSISGHMREAAGNEYQNLSIDGASITVFATQYTYEHDSIDDQYDANANYPVYNEGGLRSSIGNGGNVLLETDASITPDESITGGGLVPQTTITSDTILDLNGKTMGVNVDASTELDYVPAMIGVPTGTKLTITGNGVLDTTAGDNNSYGIAVEGGDVVIENGTFLGSLTAVQVNTGTLTVEGGFFDLGPNCKPFVPTSYAKYIINCIDGHWKDGTADIIIKGGTFVNFDPSSNCEAARDSDGKTSYLADGYTVVSEAQTNGDVWYTVVPE